MTLSEYSVALAVLLVVLITFFFLALLALGARLGYIRLLVVQRVASLMHSVLCRVAGRDAVQMEPLERRQRAAVECSGEGGAAGVGDLGVAEEEQSCLSFASPPVVVGGAPAGGGGATRAARPSSPKGL